MLAEKLVFKICENDDRKNLENILNFYRYDYNYKYIIKKQHFKITLHGGPGCDWVIIIKNILEQIEICKFSKFEMILK
jgi:hypothetical protein